MAPTAAPKRVTLFVGLLIVLMTNSAESTRCNETTAQPGDFDLHIPSSSVGNYNYVRMPSALPELRALTLSFWMQTTDNSRAGTPISYSTRADNGRVQDKALLIYNYRNVVIFLNGQRRDTNHRLNSDHDWHHFAFTWDSANGHWAVYVDRDLIKSGNSFLSGSHIIASGMLVLGQEQDTFGGGFQRSQSFIGNLSQVNVWDYAMTQENISVIYSSCVSEPGNVLAWSQVRSGGFYGDVSMTQRTNFCAAEPICVRGAGGSNVGRLVNDLFEVYGPGYVRPVQDYTQPTTVEYRLNIHELVSLSVVDQQIAINAFLRMRWIDEFLQWDPDEYGGAKEIFVPIANIWHPDITLVSNVDDDFEVMKSTSAKIESNGQVTWLTPSFFTSSCTVRVKYFPFDTQHCRFSFTSWSYNVDKIDLVVATGADSKQTSYQENSIWIFKNVTTSREIVDYGDLGSYSEISYDFIFQRRSRYYSLNIIAPFLFLSLLGVLIFVLPPEGRDVKICVAITDLLGLVVFLQIVGGALPPTGETPIIASYFLAMVIMVCISIIILIMVYYMQCNTKPPPRWFKRLVLSFMAKCVFLYDQEVYGQDPNSNDDETKMKYTYDGPAAVPPAPGVVDVKVPQTLVDDVAYLRKTVEEQGSDDQITSQWMHASRVIDRWLLIIALTVWILVTVILLTQSNSDDGEMSS